MAKGITEMQTKKALYELPTILLRKLKFIAFSDDTTQVDIVKKSLETYIEKWEKKNGPVPLK